MRRSRLVPLLLLGALPAALEAGILQATGLSAALGLAAQITAPSPFGVFHDLRWVLVYHDSWYTFAAESAASIVVRSLFNSAMVSLAADAPFRPAWWPALRMNLLFNLLVYLALAPWAAVAVAASDTSLFWFVLGEVVPLLFLSLVLQRGGIVADWWRRMPSLREVGWALVTFLALTGGSVAVYSVPGWWRVPIVAGLGAVNAWLWRRLVVAASRARPRALLVPAAPMALVLSAAALLGMGQLSTIGGAVAQRPPSRVDRLGGRLVRQQVVYVAGYDSTLEPATVARFPNPVYRYSYRGMTTSGRPLPYDRSDTHQSLTTSAARLAQQVATTADRTGRPIALIAQSEGSLVVHTYLTEFPHPKISAVILLSPLIRPGRVYYPSPDRNGWGTATGWLLRGMFAVVRATSNSHASPDEPFVRSVLDHAPIYRGRMLCPVPGVRKAAFLPFSGAAVIPPDLADGVPIVELPGLHGALLGEPDVQAKMIRFLNGAPTGSGPGLGYATIQRAGAAWEAPPLAMPLNSVWAGDDHRVEVNPTGCGGAHQGLVAARKAA